MCIFSFRDGIDRYGINTNNAAYCITGVERNHEGNNVVSDCMLWASAINDDGNCGVKGPYWMKVGKVDLPIVLRILSYGEDITLGFDDGFYIDDGDLLECTIRVRKNTPRGIPHIGVSNLGGIPYEDKV